MGVITAPARIVINKASDGEVVSILAVIDEPGAEGPATLIKSTAKNAPDRYHSSRKWGLDFAQELERKGVLRKKMGVLGPSIMVGIPGIPKYMKGQKNDNGLHVSIYNKDKDSTIGDTHAKQLAALDGKVIEISLKMDSIKLLTGGLDNDALVGCPFYIAVDVAEETQKMIEHERGLLKLPCAGYVGHLSVAGLAPSWVAHPLSGAEDEQKATAKDFTVFREGNGKTFNGWHTNAWRLYFETKPKCAPPAEKAFTAPSIEAQEALLNEQILLLNEQILLLNQFKRVSSEVSMCSAMKAMKAMKAKDAMKAMKAKVAMKAMKRAMKAKVAMKAMKKAM